MQNYKHVRISHLIIMNFLFCRLWQRELRFKVGSAKDDLRGQRWVWNKKHSLWWGIRECQKKCVIRILATIIFLKNKKVGKNEDNSERSEMTQLMESVVVSLESFFSPRPRMCKWSRDIDLGEISVLSITKKITNSWVEDKCHVHFAVRNKETLINTGTLAG